MIDELKRVIEKTFNRKMTDRGSCEALAQDIYEKTGAILSYNTLRRLFGLANIESQERARLISWQLTVDLDLLMIFHNVLRRLIPGQRGRTYM